MSESLQSVGPIDRDWGKRTASFADPDGHIWEVAGTIPSRAVQPHCVEALASSSNDDLKGVS